MDWGTIAELQHKTFMSMLERNNVCTNSLPTSSATESPSIFPAQEPFGLKLHNSKDTDCGNDFIEAEASLMRKVLRSQLVESTNNVEIQRRNPNSPLYSVKEFKDLNLSKELLKGVYCMGYNKPSKIQETALPILLADPPQNMIAQSQSGTGKTAAFVLACLSRINSNLHYPQVLILSPTYELAEQIGNVAKTMGRFCLGIEFCFAVRGEMRNQPITEQFLIGTPGKVLDWALRFKYFDIKQITVFVLDEADVMISTQGHQDQSIRIHKNLSQGCQMMFFSATYSQEIAEFAQLIVPDPVEIRLRREEESLDNIKQYFIDVTKTDPTDICSFNEQKYRVLLDIYGVITIGQAIIFCATRRTAAWLAHMMTTEGHAVGLLSGELSVAQRVDIINRFREAKEKVLIATNVCARGIDIEQVTIVVNFDLPVDVNGKADCETYLHRIGRAGRFGKNGLAINMVDSPRSTKILKDIEQHFGRPIIEVIAEDIDETTFA